MSKANVIKVLSEEEIQKMEEQKKALSSQITQAKKALAKKKIADERARRSHQMYTFAGEIEKAFEEVFGSKLYLADNDEKLQKIVKDLQRYFGNIKDRNQAAE